MSLLNISPVQWLVLMLANLAGIVVWIVVASIFAVSGWILWPVFTVQIGVLVIGMLVGLTQ